MRPLAYHAIPFNWPCCRRRRWCHCRQKIRHAGLPNMRRVYGKHVLRLKKRAFHLPKKLDLLTPKGRRRPFGRRSEGSCPSGGPPSPADHECNLGGGSQALKNAPNRRTNRITTCFSQKGKKKKKKRFKVSKPYEKLDESQKTSIAFDFGLPGLGIQVHHPLLDLPLHEVAVGIAYSRLQPELSALSL